MYRKPIAPNGNSPSEEVTMRSAVLVQQRSLDLGHLLCSNDRIVFANFRLGQLTVVERALVHVGVAVHAAEMAATATVEAYHKRSDIYQRMALSTSGTYNGLHYIISLSLV